jgi:hypothetical protein
MTAFRASLLTRAGTAAAAGAIAITGAVGTATAADAATATHHLRKLPTSLSIRVVAHHKLGFSVISGALRTHRIPLRDKVVYLESRTPATATTPGTKFTVIAQERTHRHGGVAFKVSPAATTRYKLVFKATPNFRHSHSGVVTVRVKAAS